MLVVHLDLVVSDRHDVTQRVMATCCRRQGTVTALTLTRRGDGTALLKLTVEVEPALRRALIEHIGGLVDVLEVRNAASSAPLARLSAA